MLTPVWKRRIEHWRRVMCELFYTELGEIKMEGFVTDEQLTADEAAKKKYFKPFKAGDMWGAKWQYAWFRGKAKLPAEAKGERIVARCNVGAECAIYLGTEATGAAYGFGLSVGASDRCHKEILVSKKGTPGAGFGIMIEGYGGHGPTPCGNGPVPHGVESVPEPPAKQRTMGTSTFGIWHEDLYQTYMDFTTLWHVRNNIDKESLRVSKIDDALKEFTNIVDLELPMPELLKAAKKGKALLKPLLDCKNGSTAPVMYAFGHSHIDVAWLWPLRETESKCTRTFSTQLSLMEEYPEFKFLQSQPHLFWMVKCKYPKLYERVKAAVKKGQIVPEGGMWVEADTNVTGGESLIRQFIHGKRFFKEEFGINSEMMWLPDVFGYSGSMPQIMVGCGIKYFSTQKIFWTYSGGPVFPYNTFWWEGIDGTRILAHFHNDYNSEISPDKVIERWNERVQKDGIDARLFPFGYGDGGGGPQRNHLEFIRRQKDLEGVPRVKMCNPIEFFKYEDKRKETLPSYAGELYFQEHRGTYTTQCKTKLGNRRSEFGLREAEMWGSVASAMAGYAYPMAL
ncbi:MAG: alpha-mannosidase, partial [Planctomycetes bacterium]|nr:alpha-mannosidase [Planctomycetota bacterium]